ncbi:unnamed protein product [Linum trigynum]|uniref:Uncharacterized protein n=1 Tax=Linum trigynum TaxID=586398 RepID=A0AAV2FKH2_9ROSI
MTQCLRRKEHPAKNEAICISVHSYHRNGKPCGVSNSDLAREKRGGGDLFHEAGESFVFSGPQIALQLPSSTVVTYIYTAMCISTVKILMLCPFPFADT